ncbi:MAG: asparagine synthase C-terminal domain-containing protein [Candidatus Hodarchaeales archaeon]
MKLENIINDAIRQYHGNGNIGLLYSGGLDSSIIAKILKDSFDSKNIFLVAVGMEGSYDLINASNGAHELNLPLYTCFLDLPEVMYAINTLTALNIVKNAGEILIAVPLFLGMRFLHQNFTTKIVYLGQGADELFGGYNKYSILASKSEMLELEKTMDDDLEKLIYRQTIMERQIANHFEIELIYPFLFQELIEFARNIPVSDHIALVNGNKLLGKAILRNLARDLGLSETMSSQPKKALQYGSGSKKLVKQISKEAGHSQLSNWFKSLGQAR